ncbi:putative receptor protein kinase ZmPK1 [Trifolium repens]|nr:putative receptor protein kinase ZmPK1 [Trifolium repens]
MQMIFPSILFSLLILLFHFQYSSSSFSLYVENSKDVIVSSPKGTFTAGFYPVGENAYSFAIWFTQKYNHLDNNNATVVWMANRDQPINGKRSTLSLLKNGNLVLTDAGQFDVWSTNTNSSKPLELFLYDTGNLILREHNMNGSILWQSFDFPSDTLLPSQSFTGYMKLVSSKSYTNYSSGSYKLIFDNNNLLRLLYDVPQESSVYWPDPLLLDWQDARSTYNSSRIATLNRLGNFSSSDDFTFKTSDYGEVLQRRLTLDFDGNVRVYSRKHEQEKWSVSGQFHQQPCQIHGICGPNSTCSYDPRIGRKCSCLPGYSIINNQDWSQGCKPSFQFSCNKKKSRFKFLPHVEFYNYDYGFHKNYTLKQCKHLCLRLCECIAFQFRYVKNKGFNNCYPKMRLLNGRHSTKFKGSLFLRLPKNNVSYSHEYNSLVCSRKSGVKQLGRSYINAKENGSVKFMLWFASGLGGIEVLCFFLVGWILFMNRKQSSVDNCGYVLAAAATGFRKFSYFELKKATKGFSQEIGRGAGGIVYKGVLSDTRVVAIKRLHDANQGESESLAEVSIIGRLNHMNLMGMWGYCVEGKHRLLVCEYMKNGTFLKTTMQRYNIGYENNKTN